MKTAIKIITIIVVSVLLHQTVSSQWVQQVSGTTQNLLALQVTSATRIYAAGNTGTFLKTTNGGTNWAGVTVPSTISFLCMQFLDSNLGYIGGDGGGVFRTTNAGVNWLSVSVSPTTAAALTIFFTSASTGYLAGITGFIRKTTNSGAAWTTIISGTTEDINAIVFFDANTGWFGSGTLTSTSGNVIRKTTNAGVTWTTQLNATTHITSLAMINDLTGYAGSTSQVYRTTNGGTNWNQLNPGNIGVVNSIVNGASPSIAYICCSGGRIFRTNSAGTTWDELASGTTNSLKKIDLVPNGNSLGWVAGNGGIILKTTNSGGNPISAVTTNSNEIPSGYSLSQNYPNPFNPSTKISFTIPKSPLSFGEGNAPSVRGVRLCIYDMLGSEVAVLVNEALQPGSYEIEFDASKLPTGTYFYRLSTDGFTETKKMVLIK
jgi:photosystem II stability/assembly factor-like uncharacterized protein